MPRTAITVRGTQARSGEFAKAANCLEGRLLIEEGARAHVVPSNATKPSPRNTTLIDHKNSLNDYMTLQTLRRKGAALRAKPAGDRAAGSTAGLTVAATGRWSDHLKSDTDSYCKIAAHLRATSTRSVHEGTRRFSDVSYTSDRLSNLYVGGKARSAST